MLSIITINFNNLLGLTKTVQSLREQSYQRFQWVFIDGNSTDGSVELAQAFYRAGDILLSEKDFGIYNAKNKGVRLASGSSILFLNSGDIFAIPEATELIHSDQKSSPDLLLYGFKVRGRVRMPKPLWWRYWSMPTSHQAIVYSRHLLVNHIFYENYRFSADFEHFLRIIRSQVKVKSIPKCIIINDPYGSDLQLNSVLSEYRMALVSNGTPLIWAKLVYWLKTIYLNIILKKYIE